MLNLIPMNRARRQGAFAAALLAALAAGVPASAMGNAFAAADLAFVTPDGDVDVGGTLVEARVLSAIRAASRSSGVAFPYLLAKAYRESGFDSFADAPSSSAAGIFQFTRQTWLDLFARHGAAYGQGELAALIVRSPRGGLSVPAGDAGRLILNLRHDPELAAHLAAEYTRENRGTLRRALRRKVTPEELYIAHFLGAQGAVQLLRAAARTPEAAAADVFPDAAASNPGLFYPRPGRAAASVGALHRRLSQAFTRELARFASLTPEVVRAAAPARALSPLSIPRKPDPKGHAPVAVRRAEPSAEDIRAALAHAVLPGGGLVLPWVDAGLAGAEPAKAPPLGAPARAAALRDAMAARADASADYAGAPVLVPWGWSGGPDLPAAAPLPAASAAAAAAALEIAYTQVPADRAAGSLRPQTAAPRFAAEMPAPPVRTRFSAALPPRSAGAVAGGPMPGHGNAPELAEAPAPRRGGV
ncbi:hypothetical protein [Oleispirillum naphthae]|uniref:hypothetical protein n=1 Tax=Oleispirillum naphthae TaxID=2838853 RepID=UPI00308225CA